MCTVNITETWLTFVGPKSDVIDRFAIDLIAQNFARQLGSQWCSGERNERSVVPSLVPPMVLFSQTRNFTPHGLSWSECINGCQWTNRDPKKTDWGITFWWISIPSRDRRGVKFFSQTSVWWWSCGLDALNLTYFQCICFLSDGPMAFFYGR